MRIIFFVIVSLSWYSFADSSIVKQDPATLDRYKVYLTEKTELEFFISQSVCPIAFSAMTGQLHDIGGDEYEKLMFGNFKVETGYNRFCYVLEPFEPTTFSKTEILEPGEYELWLPQYVSLAIKKP